MAKRRKGHDFAALAIARKHSTHSPKLWLGVIGGSGIVHLLLFLVVFPLSARLSTPPHQSAAIPIELVELNPGLAQTDPTAIASDFSTETPTSIPSSATSTVNQEPVATQETTQATPQLSGSTSPSPSSITDLPPDPEPTATSPAPADITASPLPPAPLSSPRSPRLPFPFSPPNRPEPAPTPSPSPISTPVPTPEESVVASEPRDFTPPPSPGETPPSDMLPPPSPSDEVAVTSPASQDPNPTEEQNFDFPSGEQDLNPNDGEGLTPPPGEGEVGEINPMAAELAARFTRPPEYRPDGTGVDAHTSPPVPIQTERTFSFEESGTCVVGRQSSLSNGMEIEFRVTVDEKGQVLDADVVNDAVNDIPPTHNIDLAYIELAECVIKQWEFEPAYDIPGQPVRDDNLVIAIALQIFYD